MGGGAGIQYQGTGIRRATSSLQLEMDRIDESQLHTAQTHTHTHTHTNTHTHARNKQAAWDGG